MRFTSFAIAAFSLSLATAMPTKRALVFPGNNDKGMGALPSVGQGVDTVINTVEDGIAGVVKGGGSSENSKRAVVLPFSNGEGEGAAEDAGQGVDGVFTLGEDAVAAVVKGNDASNAE